ncbi:MAG TPA: efflux RND transporter periplasmic adaptor subunit [Deltaproteobacteria bacterium]|nr:efflux RND transporter periplasmic adaptor subunit [Deltaproteobacteria bacterium]
MEPKPIRGKRAKRTILSLTVTLVVIILLIGFFIARGRDTGDPASELPAEKPVPVQTITIQARDMPIIVEAVGRLLPDRTVTLSALIPGEISRYCCDVGDLVAEGTVLVGIKPTDYELALAEARGNLAAARARLSAARNAFNRFEKLLPREVVSRDNFDKVESEYKTALALEAQAVAGVDIAEERLKKTAITAPFSSLIAIRHIEIGQMIGMNDPIMTLIDLSRVRLRVFLAEKDFVHVDGSDIATVTVEAYPGRAFNGRIDRLDVKADAATNTFGVEILIDNENLLLKAGLSARVRLTVDTIPDAVLIPQNAILFRENSREVFIVDEDLTAQLRTVKTGQTQDNLIRIIKGLRQGDRLIVKGQNYVKPGNKITIKDQM